MEWNDIPPAERFELVATIREMRAWRYGPEGPPWPRPIQPAALALHQWLTRSGYKEPSKPQGELFS